MKVLNLLAAACLIIFTGCEDIIDLELNNTDPRVIIEANLDATHQQIEVIVSKSNDFYEVAEQIKEMNAQVELTLSGGEVITLTVNEEGVYVASDLNVSEGERVNISVNVDGEQFVAEAQIPAEVALLSVDTSIFIFPFGPEAGQEVYRIISSWDDREDTNNFYRLRSYVDDGYSKGNFTVFNDDGMDGKTMTRPIMKPFEKGSQVTIELLSTDVGYYNYYIELDGTQSQGLNSSIPYNPSGNFSNDALGYFGAYHTSSISLQL